jgi:TatD DNase family protein
MSKQFRYIDIHGHVNFPEYDHDREEVIQRAHDGCVAMITVGTDAKTSESALKLAEKYDNMWAVVGIHPTEAKGSSEIDHNQINEEFEVIEKLATHPKVVAIGECGLDYFHSKPEDISAQRELFERHIELAQKVNKPLMLHVRNGKLAGSTSDIGNAYHDALQILKKYPHIRANFHFFAGSKDDLKNIIDRGYSVSFTGVVSFTSDYNELISSVPVTQIMSETDCPFVAPKPYRGTRNEPSYVVETVKAIAKIRVTKDQVTEDTVSQRLFENAKHFFGI